MDPRRSRGKSFSIFKWGKEESIELEPEENLESLNVHANLKIRQKWIEYQKLILTENVDKRNEIMNELLGYWEEAKVQDDFQKIFGNGEGFLEAVADYFVNWCTLWKGSVGEFIGEFTGESFRGQCVFLVLSTLLKLENVELCQKFVASGVPLSATDLLLVLVQDSKNCDDEWVDKVIHLFKDFYCSMAKASVVEEFRKTEVLSKLCKLLNPNYHSKFHEFATSVLLRFFNHLNLNLCEHIHRKRIIQLILECLKLLTEDQYFLVCCNVEVLVGLLEQSIPFGPILLKTFSNQNGYKIIQDALILCQDHFAKESKLMNHTLKLTASLSFIGSKPIPSTPSNTKSGFRQEGKKIQNLHAFQSFSNSLLATKSVHMQQQIIENLLFIIADHPQNYQTIHQFQPGMPLAMYFKNLQELDQDVQVSVLKLLEYIIAGLSCSPEDELKSLIQELKRPLPASLAHKILSVFMKLIQFEKSNATLFRNLGLIDVLVHQMFSIQFSSILEDNNSTETRDDVLLLSTDLLVDMLQDRKIVQYFREIGAVGVMQDLILSDICRQSALRIFQIIVFNDTIQNQVDVSVLIELLQTSPRTKMALKTSIFNGLVRILHKNDRAKDAFREGGFVALVSVLIGANANMTDTNPDEVFILIESLFRALTAAMSDHQKNKKLFREQIGENSILEALDVNGTLESEKGSTILQYLLDFATERSLEKCEFIEIGIFKLKKKQNLIHNAMGISLILNIMRKHEMMMNEYISFLQCLKFLCQQDPYNREQLSSIYTVDKILTQHENALSNVNHSLHAHIMDIIREISCYKLHPNEWRKLFGILQMKNQSMSLLNTLGFAAKTSPFGDIPFVQYPPGSSSFLVSLDDRQWPPSNGYSFSTWIYIDKKDDEPIKKGEGKHILFTILSILSDDKKSYLEIAVNDQYHICLKTTVKPKRLCFTGFTFEPGHWNHIVLVHQKSRFFGSASVVTLFVNGHSVQVHKAAYVGYNNLGGLKCRGYFGKHHDNHKDSWRLGPSCLYEDVFPSRMIPSMFVAGPSYIGTFLGAYVPKMNFLTEHIHPNYVKLLESREITCEERNSGLNQLVIKSETLNQDKFVFSFNASLHRLFDLTSRDESKQSKTNALFLQNVVDVQSTGRPKSMMQNNANFCIPRSLSNDILTFDGITVLLALIEKSDTSEYFLAILSILKNLLYESPAVIVEMNRVNGYQILAMFLEKQYHLINTEIIDAIWDMFLIADSEGAHVVSNLRGCKKIIFNQEIWKKTSINVQRELFKRLNQLIVCEIYGVWNISRLKNIGLLQFLFQSLERGVSVSILPIIGNTLLVMCQAYMTFDDMAVLSDFLLATLIEESNEPTTVQVSLAPFQNQQRLTPPKLVSFPSRRHIINSIPNPQIAASRNLVLKVLFDLLTGDHDQKENITEIFCKTFTVQHFYHFLVRRVHPSTLAIILKLLCFVYCHVKPDPKIYTILTHSLLPYCNQPDVSQILLQSIFSRMDIENQSGEGDLNVNFLSVLLTVLKANCNLKSSRGIYNKFNAEEYFDDLERGEKKRQALKRWNFLRQFVQQRPFDQSSDLEKLSIVLNPDATFLFYELKANAEDSLSILNDLRQKFLDVDLFRGTMKRPEILSHLISFLFINYPRHKSKLVKKGSLNHFRNFKTPLSKTVFEFLNAIIVHEMKHSFKASKLIDEILTSHPSGIDPNLIISYQWAIIDDLMKSLVPMMKEIQTDSKLLGNTVTFSVLLVDTQIARIFDCSEVTYDFLVSMVREMIALVSKTKKKKKSILHGHGSKENYLSTGFRSLNRILVYHLSSRMKGGDSEKISEFLMEMSEKDWFVASLHPTNKDIEYHQAMTFLIFKCILNSAPTIRDKTIPCLKLMMASKALSHIINPEIEAESDKAQQGFNLILEKDTENFLEWLEPNRNFLTQFIQTRFKQSYTVFEEEFRKTKRNSSAVGIQTRTRKFSVARHQKSGGETFFIYRRESVETLDDLKSQINERKQIQIEQRIVSHKFAVEKWNDFKSKLFSNVAVWKRNEPLQFQMDFTEDPLRMRKKLRELSLSIRKAIKDNSPEKIDRSFATPLKQTLPAISEQSSVLETPILNTVETPSSPQGLSEAEMKDRRQSKYILDHLKKVEELLKSPNMKDSFQFKTNEQAEISMNDIDSVDDSVLVSHTANDDDTYAITDTYVGANEDDDLYSSDVDELMDENFKIRKHLAKDDDLHHMYNCIRVTGLDGQRGLFLVCNNSFYILENYQLSPENDIIEVCGNTSPTQFRIGTDANQSDLDDGIAMAHKCIRISKNSLKHVYKRRFLLRETALEFFSNEGRNYLLVFEKTEMRKVYDLCPHHVKKVTPLKQMTVQWQKGEITNFDYLMYLNTLAGRTYNDLTQYPVFPWILQNYSEFDLENEANFRDLSKPMGALSKVREDLFKERYQIWDSDVVPKFHYGTHYSSAAIVLYYMIRLQPFTHQNQIFQGGKFDLADRLFHSIEETWSSASDEKSMSDVKELIPEFFYFPEFLLNRDKLDFGHRSSDKNIVNHVGLPKWAHNSSSEFIRLHRMALESDYVSNHLHEWIDLIFGCKQTGEAAVKATNVFYYLTYEGAVDIDSIEDPIERNATISQISNFGQTPRQLFKKDHPKKNIVRRFMNQIYQDPKFLFGTELKRLQYAPKRIDIFKKEVVYSKSHCLPCSKSHFLRWDHTDRTLRYYRTSPLKLIKVWNKLHGNAYISCAILTDNSLPFMSEKSNLLITGGSDSVVGLWNFTDQKGKMLVQLQQRLCGHTDKVTSLAFSTAYNLLVTGGADNRAIIWDMNKLAALQVLNHGQMVTNILIINQSGHICTFSENKIILWTLNGQYVAERITRNVISSVHYCCENEWSSKFYIITGHQNGLISFWKVIYPSESESKESEINLDAEYKDHGKCPITALLVPENQLKLYSADRGGHVFVWQIQMKSPNSTSQDLFKRQAFEESAKQVTDQSSLSSEVPTSENQQTDNSDASPVL